MSTVSSNLAPGNFLTTASASSTGYDLASSYSACAAFCRFVITAMSLTSRGNAPFPNLPLNHVARPKPALEVEHPGAVGQTEPHVWSPVDRLHDLDAHAARGALHRAHGGVDGIGVQVHQ